MPTTITPAYTSRQLELISILQEVYLDLGCQTPTQNFFLRNPQYPGKTVFDNAFGSWNEALVAARLPLNRQIPVYSHRRLVYQIGKKCLELGRAPLRKEVEDDPTMASPDTYIRAFGPWDKVIEVSGFTINWSTPEVRQCYQDALWRLYAQLGYREPTMFDIQSSPDPNIPCMVVIKNIYGGLLAFLATSGVHGDYVARERAKIISTYQQVAAHIGHSPDKDTPGMPDENQVRRFFKNHNEALEAAGLLPHKLQRTNTRLIKELRGQYLRTGKTPTHESIDRDPLLASSSTYRHHFGSLENALTKAHIPLGIHRRGYEGEVLEQQLQSKTLKLQNIPTQGDINSDPDMASVPTFVRYYKSWSNVKLAAQEFLLTASV